MVRNVSTLLLAFLPFLLVGVLRQSIPIELVCTLDLAGVLGFFAWLSCVRMREVIRVQREALRLEFRRILSSSIARYPFSRFQAYRRYWAREHVVSSERNMDLLQSDRQKGKRSFSPGDFPFRCDLLRGVAKPKTDRPQLRSRCINYGDDVVRCSLQTANGGRTPSRSRAVRRGCARGKRWPCH